MMGNWKEIKLIKLADFINGYAFKPSHWSKEGLPIVRIEQLKNPDSKYDYCSHEIPFYNIIDDGDLIFSWSASLFLEIWDRGKAALNQHLFKVVPNELIEKLFLKYLIEYNLVELTKAAHGSTMQHITRKELGKFDVKIPEEKHEQTRIAEILSTADEAIAQTDALISKYQRIKTGLMQDLLTRGIDANGNIRSKATHRFVVKNGIEVPEEWEVKELKSFTSYVSYGFTNPMPETEEGPYLITALNINRGRILFDTCRKTSQKAFNELLTNKSRPKIGDILITKDGTLGRVALVDRINLCINQSVAVLRPKEDKIRKEYFKTLLESPFYQAKILGDAGGSTIKHIYITKLDKMQIAVPKDLDEQDKILKTLNSQTIVIDQYKEQLSKLHALKSGLMQDLLSGRVRVKVNNG